VKGYEIEKEKFVTFTEDELKKALPKASRSIPVETFVDSGNISPAYYETPYYLQPLSERDEEGYQVVYEVLRESKLAGVVKFVMRSRQYLGAIIADRGVLTLCTLRYSNELRSPSVVEFKSAKTVSPKNLNLAQQIIQSMKGEWNPEDYRDERREKVDALIEEKARTGQMPVLVGKSTKRLLRVPDLVAQLRGSLAKTKIKARPGKKRRIQKRRSRVRQAGKKIRTHV
jgi:DNA end-binding protein Ku